MSNSPDLPPFHPDSDTSALERLFADPTETAVTSLADSLLIVEDDPLIADSVIALLRSDERELAHAGSIQAAIHQLLARRFDLILLDYRLPDATGLQLMAWLREHERGEAVIIMSGEGSLDVVVGGLRHGACDYLHKPYHPDQLRQAVRSALQKLQLARLNEAMRARLEQSERLHRYVVESSQDLIYTLTPEGHISYINLRAETLLGAPRHKLIGQPGHTLLHDDNHESAGHALRERRTGMRSAANVEIRLRHHGSSQRRHVTVALNAMGIYAGPPAEPRFLGTYGVARDITERKQAEELIAFQAWHDQLTMLPNRALFKDRLELAIVQAQRRKSLLGVMFIDLDRFKLVNDSFGHSKGDLLLRLLAERLKRCLRRGDTLARQGGDEFTVLLPDLASADDAATIANKIFAELRLPFLLAGTEFRATISMGIAIHPRDGNSAEQLIQHADIAMYDIKSRGKNSFCFFTPGMDVALTQRVSLERELQRAVQQDELFLEYQPKYDVSARRVVGVEALLRWHHPQRGTIAPDAFIAIAEESSLIHQISDWVIRQATRQLALWHCSGYPQLQLSFNLSPRDFDRDDIVGRVLHAVSENRIPPGTLEVEITENSLLSNADHVCEKILQLRHAGVRVSIDDFGTGYSSLAYLNRLPVSSLKIDRRFVHELSQARPHHPIVSAIFGVAQGFGLHTIAEGVENEEQAAALQALGCHEMQGFHFGRPVAAEAISKTLTLQ